MICPNCKSENTKTIDTRNTRDGGRRRRCVCTACDVRFTTAELVVDEDSYFWRAKESASEALRRIIKKDVLTISDYSQTELIEELLRRSKNGGNQ